MYNTHFIDKYRKELFAKEHTPKEKEVEDLAAIAALVQYLEDRKATIDETSAIPEFRSAWRDFGRKQAVLSRI